MSKEAISRVMNAEEEANAIRTRAQAEARERVSACEAACAKENARAIARAIHYQQKENLRVSCLQDYYEGGIA